jgi:2'-5' RNA ligase
MALSPTHTALIVAVPEAEPAVAALRARLDAAASWGVPAHVTVLFPFLPPSHIDDGVRAALRDIAASVPPFTVTFARTARFGDRVLYLDPDPAAPLRTLTQRVWSRFPQTPPYGGEFADVTPHLTVADDAGAEATDAAEAAVSAHLPVHAEVHQMRLIEGVPAPGGGWRTVAVFRLGPG